MFSAARVGRRALVALLFLLAATLSGVHLYRSIHSISFLRFTSLAQSEKSFPSEYKLDQVLKEAATQDNTVILTTLNEAWAAPNSVIDLFLESFRIGERTHRLLNHLVIIALDRTAFTRCTDLHTHCFALITEGVDLSGEASFMSEDYLKMMWRRIDLLRSVLEKGYNFVFTDADVMWFRDPFPRFHTDADFQIACDHFVGNSYDLKNKPNGGFHYVKSNNRTLAFYTFWHSSRLLYPGQHDQDVLNIIKRDPYVREMGLKMRFLDTASFGGMCEGSRDLNQVCTMHTNCCFGLENKVHDLNIMVEDWKLFRSLPPSLMGAPSLVSWRVPNKCGTTIPPRRMKLHWDGKPRSPHGLIH